VAVGFGSSQTVETLTGHQQTRGYVGTFAEAPDRMARDFNVRTQSTKIGVSADGVVQFREGYGSSNPEVWRARLNALVSG
jgi:hypothetical protein